MAMLEASLDEVAKRMLPGDPIFFGKLGWLKVPTHVATVSHNNGRPIITEAMFFKGVYETPLEVAMKRMGRRGRCWWIPLKIFDLTKRVKGQKWLKEQVGKDYDWDAWLKSLVGVGVEENYDALMCLEVSVGCLKAADLVPEDVNPAEMDTMEMCELLRDQKLVEDYYQILGKPRGLSWLE